MTDPICPAHGPRIDAKALGVPGLPEGSENAPEAHTATLGIDPPKTLPEEIGHRGFGLRQVARHGMLAIYEQTRADGPARYEVIRIRVEGPTTWPSGKTSPRREVYSSSEQWGTHGWTCLTLDEAERKFRELLGVAR